MRGDRFEHERTVTELAVIFVLKHIWEIEGKMIMPPDAPHVIFHVLFKNIGFFVDDRDAWQFISNNRKELAPLFDECVSNYCLRNLLSNPKDFCNIAIQIKIRKLFEGYKFCDETSTEVRKFTIKDIMRIYKHLEPEIKDAERLAEEYISAHSYE